MAADPPDPNNKGYIIQKKTTKTNRLKQAEIQTSIVELTDKMQENQIQNTQESEDYRITGIIEIIIRNNRKTCKELARSD